MAVRVSRELLAEAVRLRAEGKSLAAIGVLQGITPQQVWRRLHRVALALPDRKCVLPECDVMFEPKRASQVCCSRTHLKRMQRRRHSDVVVIQQECELPGCSRRVLRRGDLYRFCSKLHSEMHARRVRNGIYARLLGLRAPCLACGEPVILNDHHVEHIGGKSNKAGPVVPLCPTHHQAVHWGFAEIRAGVYVSRVEQIRAELQVKCPALVEGLVASGYTWADKG